jgi:hypothetical protein
LIGVGIAAGVTEIDDVGDACDDSVALGVGVAATAVALAATDGVAAGVGEDVALAAAIPIGVDVALGVALDDELGVVVGEGVSDASGLAVTLANAWDGDSAGAA